MKLVIEIDDKTYKMIRNSTFFIEDDKPFVAIREGKPLPQSATNGDMIKFMFPDAQIDYHEKSEFVEEYITVYPKDCDTCQDYPKYWWNLPYKEEGAE